MAELKELRDRTIRYLQKLQDEEQSGVTPGKLKNYVGCESYEQFDDLIEYMFERGEVAVLPPPKGGRGRKAPMIFCTRYLRGPRTPSEMVNPNFVPKLTKEDNVLLELYAKQNGHVTYKGNKILKGKEAAEKIREVAFELKEFTQFDLMNACAPAIKPDAVNLYIVRHGMNGYPERYSEHRLGQETNAEETVFRVIGAPKPLVMTPFQMSLQSLTEVCARRDLEGMIQRLETIKGNGGIGSFLFDTPEPEMKETDFDLDEFIENKGYTEEDLGVISNYGPLDSNNIMIFHYEIVNQIFVNDPDKASEEAIQLLNEIITMKPELSEFEGF